ncbi:hypothetical protein V498_10696 [Pseudogymnoascus sp. VKM F-4517 (FW-2822)]|nr:hypothetical protein V498_10696 [Pseudogymnoascus sp. VKM F-4517 (FW-2822)]
MSLVPRGINEYFIDAIKIHATNPSCSSVALTDQLRDAAVTKNGNKRDKSDRNLLFPPNTIMTFLTNEIVKSVLGCNCSICKDPPGGRDVLSDSSLVDILTRKTGVDADETRRKFCVLLFMGAGFTARHVCSFDNRGLEISHQATILRVDLFEPLHSRGLFNGLTLSEDLTARFIEIFKEAQQVFHTPKLNVGDFKKTFVNVNLPFLREESLLEEADRGRAQIYKFDIHPEFQGSLPTTLVRKELKWNEGDTRERDALQLITESKQSHLISLLCWYRDENHVNYIFEHYPGSLEHILNGTMKEPPNKQQPARYHGSRLQHWLWQGVVDAISALAFFHTPVTPHVRLGEMSAAHCDLKPANILVDDTGNLIVTDFGHAQLIKRSQRGSNTLADLGDFNYQPPNNKGLRLDTSDPTLLQACDVWSMACVLMEVIEYIKSPDGPERVKQFRANREENDNGLNRAFWIATPGGYDIRKSVRSTLKSFRSTQDQYLNSVTDLLELMLSIDPSDRPTMAQCHAIISQNVPTDEWPLLDNDEVSISGLGTSTLLRNITRPTQFARKIDSSWDERRCKMYLLLNTAGNYKRIRLALEFLRNTDGPEVTYVLSDSARLQDEVYKPLSLFDRDYTPVPNKKSLYYYHFLTAVTRQEMCIFDDGKRMRTTKCRIRPSGISVRDNKIYYDEGHVQIWKELSDAEFNQNFMPALNAMNPIDRRDSLLNPTVPNQLQRTMPMQAATSHSTGSSSLRSLTHNAPFTQTPLKRSKYRLVLLLPGKSPSYLTINLTSGLKEIQWERDANKPSSRHLTIRSTHKGTFLMGKFSTDNDCPSVPLEPREFEKLESFKADWVEIEFQTSQGLCDCRDLVAQVLKRRS